MYIARFPESRSRGFELFVKFNRCLAEKYEVRRRDRNWAVDAEDRNLELVIRLDRIGKHYPVRNVEALDRGRARYTWPSRHFPINPNFGVIVDIGREHGLRSRSFKGPDLGRYGQVRTKPQKRHFAAATPVCQRLGFDRRPRRIIKAGLPGMRHDVIGRLVSRHRVSYCGP